jgi:hypothetical protein
LSSFAKGFPPGAGASLFDIEANGFVDLPNQTTIPAGTRIVIKLSYDANGNVDGTVVTVYDGEGAELGSQTISLLGQPLTAGGTITEADLAPIVAIQVDIVGWASAAATAFTSGLGTISYHSSTPMTARYWEPTDAGSTHVSAETANSTYGLLAPGPSSRLVQTFGISTGPSAVMMRSLPSPSPFAGKSRSEAATAGRDARARE